MLRILLALLLCCATLLAVAGKPGNEDGPRKQHFSPLGLGWSYNKAIDQGMSPLLYRGSAAVLRTGYFARSSKVHYGVMLHQHGGRMATRESTEGNTNRAWLSRTELGFGYVRRIRTNADSSMRWYVGGQQSNLLNFRVNVVLGNSAANYDFLSSLGFSGRVERDFQLNKRTVTGAFRLRLPLYSYSLRPNFSGAFDINDQGEIREDVFNNRMWGSWNQVFRFNGRFMLSYPLTRGNLLQLGYEWDYYTVRGFHNVNAAMHSIVFNRSFRW